MTTVAITGSGSGIGAGIREHLEAQGNKVIGVALKNAEILADLSTPEGRAQAVGEITARCEVRLDRLVTCAGVGGHVSPKSLVAKVNYFGAVDVFDALLPSLHYGVPVLGYDGGRFDAERCFELLSRYRERLGMDLLVARPQVGAVSPAEREAALERLVAEVMPALAG